MPYDNLLLEKRDKDTVSDFGSPGDPNGIAAGLAGNEDERPSEEDVR